MAHSGVYYPFIYFRDEDWLKLMALYWDDLSRMVPDDFTTYDSPTVAALQEAGFLRNVDPAPHAGKFEEEFGTLIETRASQLVPEYGIARRDAWKYADDPEFRDPSSLQPRMSYISCGRMAPPVRRALIDSGLAEEALNRHQQPMLGMHPRLAYVYLAALADQLAQRFLLRPVTESVANYAAWSGCSIQRLADGLLRDPVNNPDRDSDAPSDAPSDADRGAPAAGEPVIPLANFILQTVVPDVRAVPVERVLQLRERHYLGLLQFQRELESFAAENAPLLTIDDPRERERQLLLAYRNTFGARLDEFQRKLREFGFDSLVGTVGIKVSAPALAGWVTGAVGSGGAGAVTGATAGVVASGAAGGALTLGPVGVAAGVTVGLAGGLLLYAGDRRRSFNQLTAPSAISYLWRLQEGLKPASLWDQVARSARRFCLGS
jgi:hypothetical protein